MNREHWSTLKYRSELIEQGFLPLDRNENLDEEYLNYLETITKAFEIKKLNKYVDYLPYYDNLANIYGLKPTNFLLTAGCDEAIRLAFQYIAPYRNILIPKYAYKGAAVNAAITKNYILTCENSEKSIEDALAIGSPSMLYLDSPSNLLGIEYSVSFIDYLLTKFPDTIILIDAAYCDFGTENYLPLLRHKNCLIARSFSKAWGLAGHRVGMLLGEASLIEKITFLRPTMSVNVLALELLMHLHNNYENVINSVNKIKQGLDYSKVLFKNVMQTSSSVNHLLIKSSPDLINAFKAKKLLIGYVNIEGVDYIKVAAVPYEQAKELFCFPTYK